MAGIFTDSVDENCEGLKELLRGLPPTSRSRAKAAAVAIEKTWTDLRKDHPKDPAVALGAAFAIFMLAQRMIEQDKEAAETSGSLIQLLS